MAERQKFSFSFLVLIRFIIALAAPFVVTSSFIFLFTNLYFKTSMQFRLTAILVVLIGFILFLYYKMSIVVIIEDDRITVKKTFLTKIDSEIKNLTFDGHVSTNTYSDRYGKRLLKSLFAPSKVKLVFSDGGERIKIDASGLGSKRGNQCIEALYNTGIKNF